MLLASTQKEIQSIEQAYTELESVIKELNNPNIRYIHVSQIKAHYLKSNNIYHLWSINIDGLQFEGTLFYEALDKLVKHIKEGKEL